MAHVSQQATGIITKIPQLDQGEQQRTKAAVGAQSEKIHAQIPQFDQREQQHTRAAIRALGEKIQKRWTSESVDPFRRVFYPENRPFNSPLRSLLAVADGPLNPVKVPVKDPAVMAAHIKEVAKFFGAHLVGVCLDRSHA